MERKLASIQRIESISPIEGADSIEKAAVLGWEVVVKKGDFTPGQLCVYCEVDSILPDRPEFEFLRDRKFRIRTIKLRGQVSQGICFPLSILKDYRLKNVMAGTDVTEFLGIKKYDPQAEAEQKETERVTAIHNSRIDKLLKRYTWYRKLFMHGRSDRMPMPSFITKTDEDRIQLFPHACTEWAGVRFIATEKLDGQSATYYCIRNPRKGLFGKKWLFGVCSRRFQLLKPDNSSYWTVAIEQDLQNKMTSWCENNGMGLIIQGEIIGPKIQGNKYKRNKYEFYLFNATAYEAGLKRVYPQSSQKTIADDLGVDTVPIITGDYYLQGTIAQTVATASGDSLLADTPREGLVVRNYSRKISFKIINVDFLLKYGE